MARSTSPSPPKGPQTRELERFEPPPDAVYNIDFAARLADLSRHTVLICCKYGLVMPIADHETAGYYFDTDAIQALRRVAALRDVCGDDFDGIKIILELLNRLERMHSEIEMLRAQTSEKSKSKPQRKRKSNRRYDYGYI